MEKSFSNEELLSAINADPVILCALYNARAKNTYIHVEKNSDQIYRYFVVCSHTWAIEQVNILHIDSINNFIEQIEKADLFNYDNLN